MTQSTLLTYDPYAHPEVLKPMLPVKADKIPREDRFAYEVKWDGIRAFCIIEPEKQVRLISRNGKSLLPSYPELSSLHQHIATRCILDGEIVAFGDDGLPDFGQVLRRERQTESSRAAGLGRKAISYIAFDIVSLDGSWLADAVWERRREILQSLMKSSVGLLQFSATHDDGQALFDATKRMGLEGIIAKEKDGLYHFGARHGTWQKLRHVQQVDALVFGVVLHDGRPRSFLLSLNSDPTVYIGRVGSGIPDELLSIASSMTIALSESGSHQEELTLPHTFPRPARGESYRYLSTPFAIIVTFSEWTDALTLRHPVFHNLITR